MIGCPNVEMKLANLCWLKIPKEIEHEILEIIYVQLIPITWLFLLCQLFPIEPTHLSGY